MPLGAAPLKSADSFIYHLGKSLRRVTTLSTEALTEIHGRKWVRYVDNFHRHGDLPEEHDNDDLGEVALNAMLDPLTSDRTEILSPAILRAAERKSEGAEVSRAKNNSTKGPVVPEVPESLDDILNKGDEKRAKTRRSVKDGKPPTQNSAEPRTIV